jgi:hypothetical protein
MATGIFFNGRLTHIPGSYVEVDVSALQRVGLGATGIIACLGEAEGGAPAVVTHITNPSKVASTFRTGDLLEAGALLFDPSKDPDIPGGAQSVKFVKVNPATQAVLTLPDAAASDSIVLTSVDYGLYTTQINVDFSAGTSKGQAITITLEDVVESIDNVGGDTVFSALYTPGANGAATMTTALDPAVGVTSAWTETQVGILIESLDATIPGKDDEQLATIAAGQAVAVHSTSAADTTQSVTVYGIENGGGLPATEVLALAGLGVVAGVTVWAEVHGISLSAACAGTVTAEQNPAGTDLHQIAPSALTSGVTLVAWTGSGQIVNFLANGATTADLIVFGTNQLSVAAAEEVTLAAAVDAPTATRWNTITAIATGYVEVARTVSCRGFLVGTGSTIEVTSNNGGDTTQVLTVFGLDGAGAAQTENITLAGAGPAIGTATWSKYFGCSLSAATLGTTISVRATLDPSLVHSAFDGTATQVQGVRVVDNVRGATVTVVSDSAADAVDILLVGEDLSAAAQAEVVTLNGVTPVPGAASWKDITFMVVGHVPVGSTLTFSASIVLPIATHDTVQKVADFYNGSDGWTLTVVTTSPKLDLIAGMDLNAASTAIGAAKLFLADLQAVIDAINAGSVKITAARATGGDATPANTAAAVFLIGGIEGTTLFSHWQAALDLIRTEEVNTVVVLTGDPAVHAALLTHCVYMAGAGAGERDGIVGSVASRTLALSKTDVISLNARHLRFLNQEVQRFNSAGVKEWFPPFMGACLAAGMQSGSSIGISLTAKYLNILDVRQDASFNVLDDGDDAIQSGIMLIEKRPGIGFRWLRNITTHLIDDTLPYIEASMNEATNYAVRELRRRMDIIVGKPGFAGTINAALAAAIGVLGELVDEGALVDWRALTLSLSADVLDLDVEVAPVAPVNFVRSTLHLVTATLTASA